MTKRNGKRKESGQRKGRHRDARRRRVPDYAALNRINRAIGDWEPGDDAVALRLMICRKIASFLGDWRHCTHPPCRRGKFCADARLFCMRNLPPLTKEQSAAAMADMQHAVRARLAQIAAGEVSGVKKATASGGQRHGHRRSRSLSPLQRGEGRGEGPVSA